MTPIENLQSLIVAFEGVYAETGAGAVMNLRNPETGDHSNVKLLFFSQDRSVEAGLYISISDGKPMRLRDAPAAIMGRGARHLPELANLLDDVVGQLEVIVADGTEVLSGWLTERNAHP